MHVFSTFAIGGPQVRFATVANRLGPAFRHAVVAMDGRLEARALLDPRLDIAFPEVSIVKGDSWRNLRSFRALLRGMRPDLLVTSNWGTIEWAIARRGLGLRHLHAEDGFGPEESAQQIPRRVLARRLLLRSATVVLPSHVLWRIAREAWRLPEARLRLVPNGVDLARFPARTASAPCGDPPVIGTVAALRPEKNIGRLVRAFALLPASLPARLVIVGDGPERREVEALAATRGLTDRILFTGHAADPASHYRGFDLFALSSDTEQMPLSLLEAMATGLPVAATDIGDVRAMLSEANRPQIVPRSDEDLAAALATLVADADLRRRLGAANRCRAEEHYSLDRMVEAWRRLFAGLD
nr:glycosyltransferase family 4 protein [Neoroseomonas soli]